MDKQIIYLFIYEPKPIIAVSDALLDSVLNQCIRALSVHNIEPWLTPKNWPEIE